uniref:Plus3 domain-containing protein n=1 Tax=Ananas comosus var. bracteatus TaxID=296719 RepID=A0A6V7NI20_ANACO|nr:unnamed protein product [Ananas comosus var. bracteatus]
MPQKVYQLGQVNGIKKVTETYKIGELKTDVILCISNMVKDVQISMLSDDDFEEEECEDLRQLVKEGLLERPTVGQLEEKAKSVHADIISHWIDRELVRLQRLIDQANEKETNPRNSSLCNENCDDRHKVIEIAGSKENKTQTKARKALTVDLAKDDDSLITSEKSKPSTTFKVISNQVICESDTVPIPENSILLRDALRLTIKIVD